MAQLVNSASPESGADCVVDVQMAATATSMVLAVVPNGINSPMLASAAVNGLSNSTITTVPSNGFHCTVTAADLDGPARSESSTSSSTMSSKKKSGMGCGRPGYITCSICNATKYYSHVQRRFGQFSCEPCSKFMKRFLRDPKAYTCFEQGNCVIGCPPGEQEPRGVSVSRCKACWLQICLDKFVLEPATRQAIDSHYLPKVHSTGARPQPTTVAAATPSLPIPVGEYDGRPPVPLPQRKRKQKDDQSADGKSRKATAANGGGRVRKANSQQRNNKQQHPSLGAAAAVAGSIAATASATRKVKRSNNGLVKAEPNNDERPDTDEDELTALAVTRSPPMSTMLFEPIYAPKRTPSKPAQPRRKKPRNLTAIFELSDHCPPKLFDDHDTMALELTVATATRPISHGMRSRSSSPFMGMTYSDHDYGGYSKNASPSPPPVDLVDCGQCFQCLSSKSSALELDLDTLASKPVVALKESCCQSKRIRMGGKNGPAPAFFSTSNVTNNVPEPESPKAGTKADTLGLELSMPSLYSASDLMGIEPATVHETECCADLTIGDKDTLGEPAFTSVGLLRHSPSPLLSQRRRSSSGAAQRKRKLVAKPLKKRLNYRTYKNAATTRPTVSALDDSDDDYYRVAAREARESLFFDEILNTNSPFL